MSPTRRILLVDDDPLVIKVYAERMRFEGWAVAIARDGWEACQEAQRSGFDMILLDIRMPYHNGVAVLKEIREGEMNAGTPVYIITSLTQGEDVDDALRLGADGVFYKTRTRPDELVKEVNAILTAARAKPVLAAKRERVGVAAGTAGEREAALLAALGDDIPQPTVAEDPSPDEPQEPVSLQRDFTVYVNPFLGDGEALSRALGLPGPYQCPGCGGQVCLRLSPDLRGSGTEMVGFFHCSRCDREI